MTATIVTGTLFTVPTPAAAQQDTRDTDAGCSFMDSFLGDGFQNTELEVLKLQLFLNAVMDSGLTYTMRYDEQTKDAVRAFQKKHTSEVLEPWVKEGYMDTPQATGLTYITTRTKIDNMLCPDKEPGPLKPAER